MTAGLLEQLHNYAEDFDAAVAPITLDEVTTRVPAPGPLRPAKLPRRLPGWVYAVMAAVIVLTVGVGILLLDRLLRDTPPVQTTTTITTTTTVETTTTTTAPEPVGAPVGPPPRWWPGLADIPGPGVLMLGGMDSGGLDQVDMWSFQPDAGWEELPSSEATRGSILGYDPTTELVWVAEAVIGEAHLGPHSVNTPGLRQLWTYAPGTGTWTRIETTGAPPEGFSWNAALDVESRRLVFLIWLIEEDEPGTWVLDIDAHQWTRMNPDATPGLFSSTLAYDAESDRVILWRGSTWAYDFNSDTWTVMAPESEPPQSEHAMMVYDPVTDRMILFGGGIPVDGPPFLTSADETWAYDHNTDSWTRIETSRSPSGRELAAMAHDADTGMIVLFGGGHNWTTPRFTELNDTWLFDPAAETWTEWTPPD